MVVFSRAPLTGRYLSKSPPAIPCPSQAVLLSLAHLSSKAPALVAPCGPLWPRHLHLPSMPSLYPSTVALPSNACPPLPLPPARPLSRCAGPPLAIPSGHTWPYCHVTCIVQGSWSVVLAARTWSLVKPVYHAVSREARHPAPSLENGV